MAKSPVELNICMSEQFVFNGCSLTFGSALLPEQKNFATLVSNHFNVPYKNISVPGTDNHSIFLKSMNQIYNNKMRVLFVQWTYIDRVGVHVRSTSSTNPTFNLHQSADEIFYNNPWLEDEGITLTHFKTYLKYSTLLHRHHKLFHDVMQYIDIIYHACLDRNIRPCFINAGIFKRLAMYIMSNQTFSINNMPSSVKELLDVNTLDDFAIIKQLTVWREIYQHTEDYWLNFGEPWVGHWQDRASDNSHPGPLSHNAFSKKIIEYITPRLG